MFRDWVTGMIANTVIYTQFFMSHWSYRSGFENVFHLHSWIHHHLRIKILSFDLLSALDVHSIEEKIKKIQFRTQFPDLWLNVTV